MTGQIVTPGLVPSATLAPSASLAPQGVVYAGGPITPHQVALACGTNGAYVDVSAYVEFGEGLTYTYGASDQFSDVPPGTFTFTLNNTDGRFTPANPTSPLATRLFEGMGVAWLLGSRLVHTSILAITIPADNASWYQLHITCDDMLGDAGRHQLTALPDDLSVRSDAQLMWRLDESSGLVGIELHDSMLGAFTPTSTVATSTTQMVTFGKPQTIGLPGTAVTITAAPGETVFFGTAHGNTTLRTTISYPIPTDTSQPYYYGWWNMWVYPGSTGNLAVTPYWAVGTRTSDGARYSDSMQVLCTPTTIGVKGGTAPAWTRSWTIGELAVPHYVSMRPRLVWQSSGTYWALFVELWIDDVFQADVFFQSAILGYTVPNGLLTAGTAMQPLEVNISVTNTAAAGSPNLSGTFQRVSHTLNGNAIEVAALRTTEDGRRDVLDVIGAEINSATYTPAGALDTSPLGFPDVSGRSILDVFNDIIRTEQGHLFCTTSGGLLSPTETIQLRARDRPTTVTASFDVTDELDGTPTFVRDISNVTETVQVTGPSTSVTVKDITVASVTQRFLKSGQSETILNTDSGQLRLWGQDRINRGKNVAIRADTYTIDAASTPVDRSTDLLNLLPGDRVRLTGLPAGILGFSSWDGWLLGASESHSLSGGVAVHTFTFRFQPTLPDPAVADTAVAANDGAVTLTGAVTATDTSLPITTTGPAMSPATPYDLTLGTGGEQVRVTAVTASALTVVRGVNGTTAIAHTTAAPLEVIPVPYAGF